MSLLESYRTERAGLIEDVEALMNAKDFSPKDTRYVEARSKAEALDEKIEALVKWQQSRAAQNEVDALSVRHRQEVEQRDADSGLTPGQLWTRSKAFEQYRQTYHGTSATVEVPLDSMLQERAAILTTTFTGILPHDRIKPSSAPALQTPLLSIMDRVQVSQNAVDWVFYPAAAPLAGIVAEGAQKPEAVVAPVLKTVTLDTVAHWIQFSRQFAEDAGALMTYIDGALRRGVTDKLEAEAAAVLVAAGSGIPTTDNTGGDLLSGIRRAIANVQTAGFNPTIAAVNPADYGSIDLAVMAGTLNGPVVNGSFWGVRVVPVGAIPSGTAFVGDFQTAMALLIRNDVRLYQTDSHAANFTLNVLVQLAEARAKTVVHRPEAITKVLGTAAVVEDVAASKRKA